MNGDLLLEVNSHMESRVNSPELQKKPLMATFTPSEFLITNKMEMKDFHLQRTERHIYHDKIGKGNQTIIWGEYREDGYCIRKRLEYIAYDSFPGMLVLNVDYINIGKKELRVLSWVNNHYEVKKGSSLPAFWSFQGSSSSARKDWLLPVDSFFYQRNFMGMNNTDYGGGIPVIDLWRKDVGIAIGELELTPKLISLPVQKDMYDSFAQMSLQCDLPVNFTLHPKDSLHSYTTFVSVHKGDCFKSLRQFSRFMQASGIRFAPFESDAYQSVWCSRGYGRKCTVDEILAILPKIKELGLKWVDIDDGYQQAESDWNVSQDKFPGGSKDMRKLVDNIHLMGLKAKLFWTPLAIRPSSQLYALNPDIIQQTADGAPQFITGWNCYYMSPSYYKTIEHAKSVISMFILDWDYDGLKMDGQHLNCVPPDYNENHHLRNPIESFENLPAFYKMIFETVRSYKPHAVLQLCPCGDVMSFYNMPWINQTVASDPLTSWQIRLKGKVYKAIMGNSAYYGDHVELTDGGADFASQVGIGAVLGTGFTWPKENPDANEKWVLTPDKEEVWKKWISIYNNKMLSKEDYLGDLYDIGYDKPETHVISKTDTLFYAFYAKGWKGKIRLRGLKAIDYEVIDYVNGKNLGKLTGPTPLFDASFSKNLLIEVYPIKK